MSRLESFIRRMAAQRDILDALASQPDIQQGLILEFGLGSGRTYDHLRARFPGRRIMVFEAVAGLHALTAPPSADLLVGDIRETAAMFADGCAAFVHSDIETGVADVDAALSAWLPGVVARLLAPGGYAASGSPLPHPQLDPQPLPPSVEPGRYHLVRRR